MPTDTKRLPVPEGSLNYRLFSVDKKHGCPKRKETERIRPLFLKVGVVSQAKGSAYIEQNNTKVICAVYGPREVPRRSDFSIHGQLFCDFKFAPFSCQQRRGHQKDSEEKELTIILQDALQSVVCLHQFPKAQVDVYVMVLENDGAALAAAITCSSLALADAGIAMFDLAVGATLCFHGGSLLVDPVFDEEEGVLSSAVKEPGKHGRITIGHMASLQQVCAFTQDGSLELEQVSSGMRKLVEVCEKITPIVQECLIKSVKHKDKQSTT